MLALKVQNTFYFHYTCEIRKYKPTWMRVIIVLMYEIVSSKGFIKEKSNICDMVCCACTWKLFHLLHKMKATLCRNYCILIEFLESLATLPFLPPSTPHKLNVKQNDRPKNLKPHCLWEINLKPKGETTENEVWQ